MEVAMKRLHEPIGMLFLMIAFALAAARTSNGKLAGVVRDSEGAVISNAIVLVHWDTDGSQGAPGNAPDDRRFVTSKTGEFSADLTAGFYDIAVFAHAFSPNAHKVRIRIGQTTNDEVTLPLDPQISAEIGGMQVESADTPSRKLKQ
jgi:Carboxypeptidase regulatory-like domain